MQVMSNGYLGSGNTFIATTPGQSPFGSNTAFVQAISAAAPQIRFFGGQNCDQGTNIAGNSSQPLSVIVGQKIELCAVASIPAGLSIANQMWTTPFNAIGGYTVQKISVPPATAPRNPYTYTPTLTANANVVSNSDVSNARLTSTFYGTVSGDFSMTYTYLLSNNQSASATVSINVDGPSGVTLSVVQIPGFDSTAIVTTRGNLPNMLNESPIAGSTQPGIKFQADPNQTAYFPPSNPGLYSWVQLVDHLKTETRGPTGLSPVVDSIADAGAGSQLDGTYPYGTLGDGTAVGTVTSNGAPNNTAVDNPGVFLFSAEVAHAQNSTMFLMWTPNVAGACNDGTDPSPCAVPVPLGSISWQWSGDAIDTLRQAIGTDSQGTFSYVQWIVNCGSASNMGSPFEYGFQTLGPPYPVWTQTHPLN